MKQEIIYNPYPEIHGCYEIHFYGDYEKVEITEEILSKIFEEAIEKWNKEQPDKVILKKYGNTN